MTVGGGGVAVEVAAQIRPLHQIGQQTVAGGLDLAPVFPELRRDIGQVNGCEDRFLGLARHPVDPFEDAVLVELEPLAAGEGANRDVVGLAAGEIVQGGAEALAGHHPQVHLQTAAEDRGRAGVALGTDLGHLVVVQEAPHGGRRVRGGDQDVQVADGLPAASVAAGDHHAIDP